MIVLLIYYLSQRFFFAKLCSILVGFSLAALTKAQMDQMYISDRQSCWKKWIIKANTCYIAAYFLHIFVHVMSFLINMTEES